MFVGCRVLDQSREQSKQDFPIIILNRIIDSAPQAHTDEETETFDE